jgi:endoglucanase
MQICLRAAAVLAITLLTACSTPQATQEPFVAQDAFAQNAAMARGVNIWANALRPDEPQRPFDPKRHFQMIHQAGFTAVRLAWRAFEYMDASNTLSPAYLARMDEFVHSALDAGLIVIVDEHDYEFCSKDVQTCRVKLDAFWTQIGARYKDLPGRVVFEMLNEPFGDMTAERWNEQIKDTLPIIRATNPTRNVIIGPGNWNGMEFLPKLQLPDDPHLIVTFHYYHPMDFTHQGASWAPAYTKLGVAWGTPADIALLNQELDSVKAWATANKRPILLGEFGTMENGKMADRAAWTSAVARGAEARGFSWAYWQFSNNMMVFDTDKDAWVQPILDALIPASK